MRFLQYKDLDLRRVRPAFDKVRAAIEAGDFRSADVKKLHAGPYYRARLDHANRLLLQFARIDGQTVCLALEVILNHAYDHSRFLRGAAVDESRIEHEPTAQAEAVPEAELAPLRWLHPQRAQFELLDKPVVFDDAQQALSQMALPLVVAGSAGSGKTALTISRLRDLPGRVLYVTLSPYLAQGALALYGAHGFENPAQEADFLSFREFLETMRVPSGREVDLRAFRGWFDRHRQAVRALGDIDAHALFEEFRGVIGAQPGGPMALQDYLALGPRPSLLPAAAREGAHALFQRYRQWLAEPAGPAARRGAAAGGARLHQGRMGAGGAQARAAGQGRAGAGHPPGLPAAPPGALDAVGPAPHRAARAQGFRGRQPEHQAPAGPPRLRAVAWAAALGRAAGGGELPCGAPPRRGRRVPGRGLERHP
jgi:hypothetical protein